LEEIMDIWIFYEGPFGGKKKIVFATDNEKVAMRVVAYIEVAKRQELLCSNIIQEKIHIQLDRKVPIVCFGKCELDIDTGALLGAYACFNLAPSKIVGVGSEGRIWAFGETIEAAIENAKNYRKNFRENE
jgi:hypothetical protein